MADSRQLPLPFRRRPSRLVMAAGLLMALLDDPLFTPGCGPPQLPRRARWRSKTPNQVAAILERYARFLQAYAVWYYEIYVPELRVRWR